MTLQHVVEPRTDSWTMGLTDSRVFQGRISFTKQAASNFLTAPRPLTSPAPSHDIEWLADIKEEMRSYSKLAPDWDSYGGEPVQEDIVETAVQVARIMAICGFSRPEVCPESSGGVLLEWQQSDRALTVDLDGIEGFSFSYESPGEPEWEGGFEDFVSLLKVGLQPF